MTTASAKRTSKKSTGRTTPAKPRKDIYQSIVDRITALSLSENKLIWRKSWKASERGSLYPRSVATGKVYRGINPWLLMAAALEGGWTSQWYATYDQWAKLAGAEKDGNRWVHPEGADFGVRKGEKGTHIVFWQQIYVDAKDANGNLIIDPATGKPRRKRIPMLREFVVFNQDQCHQATLPKKFQPIEVTDDAPEFDPIAEAEAIVAGYDEVPVNFGGNRAFYSPRLDTIGMPEPTAFDTPEEYYSTLFHEFGHSTGAAKRLARPDLLEFHHFGDESYTKEELVAEMTAAMLAGISGIENVTIDNSAAYLQGWLSKLQSEPKLLVQAAAQAQKAADYILGVRYDEDGDSSEFAGAKEKPEEVIAA